MKNLKFVAVSVVLLVAGYFVGNFFPFSIPQLIQTPQEDIKGNVELKVSVVAGINQPVPNLEIDLGKTTGPPPAGGVAKTNENGIAIFLVKPGNYVVYFNEGTFPKNLEHGPPQPVTVLENSANNVTVVLKSK